MTFFPSETHDSKPRQTLSAKCEFMRLASPIEQSDSCITSFILRMDAARHTGTETKPPFEKRTSGLSPNMAGILPESFPSWAVSVISFASLALAGFLAVVLVGKMARKIVETFNLGVVDNILGFIWGLVFSLLVFSVIVYLLTIQPVFDLTNMLNSSVIITRIINPLLPGTISTLENIAQEGMNAITQIS